MSYLKFYSIFALVILTIYFNLKRKTFIHLNIYLNSDLNYENRIVFMHYATFCVGEAKHVWQTSG